MNITVYDDLGEACVAAAKFAGEGRSHLLIERFVQERGDTVSYYTVLSPAEYDPIAPDWNSRVIAHFGPRPIVMIIETPEEDPTILEFGDVEVLACSAYPATEWARDDVKAGEYADYVEDCLHEASRLDALGATLMAEAQRNLAADFEEEHNA